MELSIARAMIIMDITLPSSKLEIRKSYRRLAFMRHPDRGGSEEGFKELTSAFELLKDLGTEEIEEGVAKESRATLDGTPLRDLGKGYPLTEHARSCDTCLGKGYRMYSERRICYACRSTGYKLEVACKKCSGTGVFKKDGRVIGKCYACDGKKVVNQNVHSIPFFRRSMCEVCDICKGEGIVNNPTAHFIKCDDCSGVGELKMWNPALPRGYLHAGKKSK